MRRKNKTIALLVIVFALFAYLAISSASNSVSYYMTISELKEAGDSAYGETFNINGSIVKESIDWEPEKQELQFVLTNGNESIDVIYKGSMPQNFKEATSVVVTGQYSDDHILRSKKMLVKCPSKYSENEIVEETYT